MNGLTRINAKDYLSVNETGAYYFEVTGRGATKENQLNAETPAEWGDLAMAAGDYEFIPFGNNDDVPNQIVDAVYPNHIAPRIQNRKIELLIEQGPYLYQEEADGTNFTRKPVIDAAIKQWLEEQNYQEQLHCTAGEYFHVNAIANFMFRNRAGRIGSRSGIAKTEPISATNWRLAYKKTPNKKYLVKPTHIIVGDFKNKKQDTWDVYPIYDPLEPTKYPISIHYTVRRSFGVPYYSAPEILGAIPWIKNSTAIPKILTALTENSLNIKWHIQSPAAYWEEKRKILKGNLKDGEKYSEKMLDDLRDEILKKLTQVLSGVDNVGKFWHNPYVVTLIGGTAHEQGWRIEPIEQKILDYVRAQLEIAQQGDRSVLAAFGLHSALANVGADGKSDSGAEQLYALTNHQRTSVMLAEYYVTKALNDAIKANFNTDIKIGFWHINVAPLQEQTPGSRAKNQNPTI
ncbi:hypothetical protein ACH3O9_11365 [Leeuwenhoekiella sp. A16]|uniref:hypothetical protein n=1 Tax=Leeuwenhoekiella sp. A16 TaxID=3141462 RepID=UPI003A809922